MPAPGRRETPALSALGQTVPAAASSVVFLQIHAGVKARHLVGIAIEHQRWTLAEFANPAFAGLAPAGMIFLRVHIGIKTILIRRHFVPGCWRHGVSEADLHDCLDPFEAVLPR